MPTLIASRPAPLPAPGEKPERSALLKGRARPARPVPPASPSAPHPASAAGGRGSRRREQAQHEVCAPTAPISGFPVESRRGRSAGAPAEAEGRQAAASVEDRAVVVAASAERGRRGGATTAGRFDAGQIGRALMAPSARNCGGDAGASQNRGLIRAADRPAPLPRERGAATGAARDSPLPARGAGEGATPAAAFPADPAQPNDENASRPAGVPPSFEGGGRRGGRARRRRHGRSMKNHASPRAPPRQARFAPPGGRGEKGRAQAGGGAPPPHPPF